MNEDQNNRNPCPFMEDVMPCNFQWGRINGEVFSQQITRSYEEIVKWKRNFFLVPSGKVGKSFIQELARLYQAYADESPLECISLKACAVMQCLLFGMSPKVKQRNI